MALTQQQMQTGLARLGVTPQDFDLVRRQTSLETAGHLLAELKKKAKTNYKKLALELHPDRTGGDEAKTDEFKHITAVLDEVEKLAVRARPPPPRPNPLGVVFAMGMPYAQQYGGTSTTTTGNGFATTVTFRINFGGR
jgi:DnaJ domain